MTHKAEMSTLGFLNLQTACLSVYQIHYKVLEDRKFGFLMYFLTERTQKLFIVIL